MVVDAVIVVVVVIIVVVVVWRVGISMYITMSSMPRSMALPMSISICVCMP